MKEHIVKIRETFFVTHDVKCFIVERPGNYKFEPGQATEVAINKDGWKKEKRPFSFTGLPEDDFLQFIIKTYPEHKGVTNEMLRLKEGDELILHEVFGSITYQGHGTFIAGGAGITPFIAILRNLKANNKLSGNRLIFANKKKEDIILQKEFEGLLGKDFVNILSDEETASYPHGFITKDFLKAHLSDQAGKVYLCGPPPMMDKVPDQIKSLGISGDSIIKEGI